MGSFNKNLSLIIVSLVVFLLARLAAAALESENWPGFVFSAIHVLAVAAGAYLALRDKGLSSEPSSSGKI